MAFEPPISVSSVLYPHFRGRNFVAYNYAASACAVFAFFLAASSPFYLTEVLGISTDRIGKVVASLGVVDQLTGLIAAPLVGTLNDRLQGAGWKSSRMPSGPRIMQLGGFTVLALALFGHGLIATPGMSLLYVLRALSAVGIASVTGITMVMLHEASNSDFTWSKLKFWARKTSEDERTLAQLHEEERADGIAADEDQLFVEEASDVYLQKQKRYHGKLAAVLGIASGLGPFFAIIFGFPFLALLVQGQESWSTGKYLQASYMILAGIALVAGAIVYALGYDSIKQRKLAQQNLAANTPDATYLELLKEAVHFSLRSRHVQLAYIGGIIARFTTLVTTVFTPVMVYKFYSATGTCGQAPPGSPPGTPGAPGAPGAPGIGFPGVGASALQIRADTPQLGTPELGECFNALIFTGFLLGVASTMSFFSIPVWIRVVDSAAQRAPTGADIASTSLVTMVGQSLEDPEHRVIGTIVGLYRFVGGAGALVLAMVGGAWSDHWVFGPFFLLGLLNAVLAALVKDGARGNTQI
ncbi:hypothetical protein JCM33374_g4906 [Metschnikowia sp. JCM 33374]|nr:hypothetical protein JCM33374_g4906 [Metschnikowia sp. JCM 33374]